jgi:ATP-dependent RNA helicase RhlE
VSEAIHGNKSQTARQRALENFRAGRTRVLVATDIAARGIDIDNITHVINFEVPNIAESYVHRIGRTARAGTDGIAISFCDAEERAFIKDIEKLIAQPIPVNREHPFHSAEVENARMMSKGKAKAAIEASENRPRSGRGNRRRPRRGGEGQQRSADAAPRQQASGRDHRHAPKAQGEKARPAGQPHAKPHHAKPHGDHAKPRGHHAKPQGGDAKPHGHAARPAQGTQKSAKGGGILGWLRKKA